jgi:hypothetical protein
MHGFPKRAPAPTVWSMRTLIPTWSTAAALRSVRVAVVVAGLFAFTSQVVGNVPMAIFAAFGSFATLLFASFGGTRRDKLVAHTILAVAGSVLIIIGTAASFNTAVVAAVTVPVAFCVLFSGIVGPNAASGAVAALVAYVLPATSRAGFSVVPDRLAGWWLASACGTLAVLLLSPRPGGDRLRASAANSAFALADQLDGALARKCTRRDSDAAVAAEHTLMNAFDSAPYRPTGLAVPDQALANLVVSLEWCTTALTDAFREGTDLTLAPESERHLFAKSGAVLRKTARLLGGEDVPGLVDDIGELESSVDAVGRAVLDGGVLAGDAEEVARISFHARLVAVAAISCATDALVATRHATPAIVSAELSRWRGGLDAPRSSGPRVVAFDSVRWLVSGNASLRSVCFLNSARAALAVAAAVAVADVANVQNGFWVVLGTISVLRTNATSTEATALRALGGTVIGFFIGAGLIIAIGSHTAALWIALPIAVLIAGYAPGTLPFAIGQAFFTVTIFILFNILVPVGWKVGVVRLEDVAIGAAVSAAVGAFFWPRGASKVVADDLADAFHRGGVYLAQATAWALATRPGLPESGAATVLAGSRLDDAMRGLMAEQGSKKVPKEQIWRLVSGTRRLRLTAQSLTASARPETPPMGSKSLVQESVRLAGLCDDLARRLSRTSSRVARELATLPAPVRETSHDPNSYALWVREHLVQAQRDLATMVEPVTIVAERWAQPWWR